MPELSARDRAITAVLLVAFATTERRRKLPKRLRHSVPFEVDVLRTFDHPIASPKVLCIRPKGVASEEAEWHQDMAEARQLVESVVPMIKVLFGR